MFQRKFLSNKYKFIYIFVYKHALKKCIIYISMKNQQNFNKTANYVFRYVSL